MNAITTRVVDVQFFVGEGSIGKVVPVWANVKFEQYPKGGLPSMHTCTMEVSFSQGQELLQAMREGAEFTLTLTRVKGGAR